MKKKALLSYSRGHFDPTGKEQLFYSASASIIAKSLYDSLGRAGYEVEYIDAAESPKNPDSYNLFIGQPRNWVEIAGHCAGAVKILFMPTSHPSNRNERMHEAQKKWGVPREEEILDESYAALRAFKLADYIIQIGNEVNIDALLKNGVPRGKIFHIHYGLPPEWSADAPQAHGSRESYLHVASELGLRKGLPTLVHLFSATPFNAKLLTLMGEIRKNENHAYWTSRITELEQHNSQVTRLGFIDSSSEKYREILARHAWYLFPSLEEGEPGTVLDAMTLGLVPVLTRESGIDFALDDDFTASFETSLAKTLDVSQTQWQILSAKAQRYIELFHDHALWEDRLTDIFRRIDAGEKDLRPSASIILTVHDKEKHIVRLLETLVANTKSYPKWDIHIVYDGCTDASREAARKTLCNFPVPVYEYETPDVWEVKANNYGLKRANGKYCIILQDDNFIYEHGWLEKMLSWLEEHPRVGILGGLAGVNFFHLDSDPHGAGVNHSIFEVHQRLDPAVDKKLSAYVFEADAVMRGPIIMRKELLEKHGYLDEAYAPLYNDDMDYCFRIRSLGYGVFCYPIDVINENLTVAKYKNPEKDKFWRNIAEKNQRFFYERWKDDIEKHHAFQLKVPRPVYGDMSGFTIGGVRQHMIRNLHSIAEFNPRKKLRATARVLFLATPAPIVRAFISLLKNTGGRGRSLSDFLHTHYFGKKELALPSSERPVFWTGSGGCGFLRVYDLLKMGGNSSVFFKSTSKLQNYRIDNVDSELTWERGTNETGKIQRYFARNGVHDHHIAPYTIRYVKEIIEHSRGDAVFLCLKSMKSIESLWIQLGYRNPLIADRTRKNRYPVQLFPDLTALTNDSKLATQKYYDLYYEMAEECQAAYPDNFCIVDADRFFTDKNYFISLNEKFNLELEFKVSTVACGDATITTSLHGGIGNNFFQMAEPVAFCAEHNLPPPSFATWDMSDFPLAYRNDRFIGGHTGTIEELRYAFPHINWLSPARPTFDYKFMLNDMFAFADVHHQRDALLSYFSPASDVQKYLEEKYPAIQDPRTVSLHYRVGGLIADTHAFSPLNIDWYKKVFTTYFPEQYHCFVFSDNPDASARLIEELKTCTKNIYTVIDENVFNTVIMMSRCRNHILSNSTLSFWGAYLDPRQPAGTTVLHNSFTTYHSEPHIECRMLPYPEWKII